MSEWISVKEKLPEDGRYVLGIGGSILRVPHPMRKLRTKYGIEWWYGLTQFNPTHWQPLPDPPKESTDAD